MTRSRVQLEFLAVVVAAATLLQCAVALRTFVVGDGLGWALPPSPNTFAIWASNHSFAVNDILLFKFVSGNNTVAKVSKEAYEACDTSVTPMFIRRHSPAFIFLNTTGDKFFIDTIGDHCLNGLKLSIKVNPLSPAAPTPSPPNTPPTTPSPPPGTPPSPTGSPPPGPSPTTSPSPSPTSNTPATTPSPPPGTPSPSMAPPPSPSNSPPATPSPPPGPPGPSTAPPPVTTPGPALSPQAAASPPLSSSSPPTSTDPPPPPPSRSAASATYSSLDAVFLSFALGYLIWN